MHLSLFTTFSLNILVFPPNIFEKSTLVHLSTPTLYVLCNAADSNLFASILNNSCHGLHKLLTPISITRYSMRLRSHNREFLVFDYLSKKRFLTRMQYK